MPRPFKSLAAFLIDFFMGQGFEAIPQQPERFQDLSPDDGKAVFDRAMAAAGEAGKRADAWGMEVLKNLVVINGAGLAGVFTLYQINCLPRAPGLSAIFISGVTFAFVALMLGWYLQKRLATMMITFAIQFRKGDVSIGEMVRRTTSLRPLAGIQVSCGVISLALFICGAAKIYTTISAATNCH